jgi:polyisoprenoid-binding protein YceI
VHPLHTIEAVSKETKWKITIDTVKQQMKSVSAQVDVMTFDSGNSNRDSHAMEVIDALTYPDVTFSSTSVAQHGDSLSVSGKLTFHGITRDITASAVWSVASDTLKIHGGFGLSLTAFNIDRPSFLMVPVEDTLKFSLAGVFLLK